MAGIEWGKPIAVDGKRPAWLRDSDQLMHHDKFSDNWHGECVRWWVYELKDDWPLTDLICLPANSPVYTALEAGFVPWAGGDTAPADWDGGEVLWESGSLSSPGDWRHTAKYAEYKARIIGYKRKAEVVEDDGHTVTIARMTETDFRDKVLDNNAAVLAANIMGIIRTPTRAEVISTTTGVSFADVEKVLAEIAS